MKSFVEGIFEDLINEIHTIKPCVVTAVDYSKNLVDVSILTKTRIADGVQEEFPDLSDIPLMVLSGSSGTARITLPVSVGDNVIVLMSDRSYSTLISETSGKEKMDSDEFKTHDLYPILAIPCFYTAQTAQTIDPLNIVIENGTSKIEIEPSGKISVVAQTAEITCESVSIDGDVSVTGKMDVSGIVSGQDFKASSIPSPFSTHTHPIAWTDPAGSGSSGVPV